MQGSRVLSSLIATLASIGVVSPESGESYCTTDGTYCHVYGDDPDNFKPEDDAAYDGPNWVGGDSTTVDPYCEDADCNDPPGPQICDMIEDVLPEDCNIYNPSPLIPNGCGTGIFTDVVPDSLIVPYVLVHPTPNPFAPQYTVAPFGNMFTYACNNHDSCYGNVGSEKEHCDRQLNWDMVNDALVAIPSWEHEKYMSWAETQAFAYSISLRHPFVSFVASQSAFDEAQADAMCRSLAKQLEEEGCL